MWQLHAQDFLQKMFVHADFERDLLFTTLKTKESKTLQASTPLLRWSARARSRRELPYSADWGTTFICAVPTFYNVDGALSIVL